MEQQTKLWTKEFFMLSLINFLATIVYFLLLVTIAKFAVHEFGVSTSMAGLASSIFIIGSLFGRLGGGRFISRFGSQTTLFVGLVLFILSTCGYFIAFNMPLLLLIRIVQGIAVGLVGTATGTIIAQILPTSRRGEGIGYFSLSAILATAVGPYIGLLLLHGSTDFSRIFIFNAALAVIVFIMYFLLRLPAHVTQPAARTTEKVSVLHSFIEKRAVPISIVALFVGLAYSGILSFMSFYTAEIELEAIGGYFFLIYAAVVVCTRPFTGKLLDQKGANIIIYPCLLLFAIGMYLFSTTQTTFTFIIAAIFIGIGYGNFTSVAQAIAVKVTPRERLGLATSTFYILYDIGLGFGPYALGLLVPAYGYRVIFFAMVFVILFSLVLYYVVYGKKASIAAHNEQKAAL